MNAKAHFRGPGLISPGARKGDGPPVLPSSPKLLSGVQGLLSGVEWAGPKERMKENDEAEKEQFSGGDNGVTRSLVCVWSYSWMASNTRGNQNCFPNLSISFVNLILVASFLVSRLRSCSWLCSAVVPVLFRFSVATTRPNSAPCTQPCSTAQLRCYPRCAALRRDWTCQL